MAKLTQKKERAPKAVKKTAADILPLAVCRTSRGFMLLLKRTKGNKSELLTTVSRDGREFSKRFSLVKLNVAAGGEEDLSRCRDFRLSGFGSDLIMTYVRDREESSAFNFAATMDCKTWLSAGDLTGLDRAGIFVPIPITKDQDAIFAGGDKLSVSVSADLKRWSMTRSEAPADHFFDGGHFDPISAWPVAEGIVVFFGREVKVDIMEDRNLSDQKVGEEHYFKLGAALFDRADPTDLLWWTELPLLELLLPESGAYQLIGLVPADDSGETLRAFLTDAAGRIQSFDLPADIVLDTKNRPATRLAKHAKNPIMAPSGVAWEEGGVFNPTAVDVGDRVHLLYRAVGNDGYSYIGYANSKNGLAIDERLSSPVYGPKQAFGAPADTQGLDAGVFASGGSWGGCEDPKVTMIEDTIYLTYVAHNGYWPMRTALTSISVADFLAKRFDRWTEPMLMSAPNQGSKSVVILPEKVNGQYIIFHRLWPNIVVDVVPELEFGPGKRWLAGDDKIPPRRSFWDSQKLSLGAAPIKTDKGWLAVYNAVDRRDSSRYKIGAMLLDRQDPRRVIARSREPILSPDEWYENAGKPGIAYPGGAVERDGQLYVYYGGADRVSCVATIPTDEMLWHLERDRSPILKLDQVRFA